MSEKTADQNKTTDQSQSDGGDAPKKTLTLSLKKPAPAAGAIGSPRSRSKTVQVEVKRRRSGTFDRPSSESKSFHVGKKSHGDSGAKLSDNEMEARMRAVQEAQKNQKQIEEERAARELAMQKQRMENMAREAELAKKEEAHQKPVESAVEPQDSEVKVEKPTPVVKEAPKKKFVNSQPYVKKEVKREIVQERTFSAYAPPPKPKRDDSASNGGAKRHKDDASKPVGHNAPAVEHVVVRSEKTPVNSKAGYTKPAGKTGFDESKKPGYQPGKRVPNTGGRSVNNRKLLNRADENFEERGRSLASVRRARQKQKNMQQQQQEVAKVIREVTITETIMVGELANRMAVRGADVVKELMRLGMMVTINQVIDADTAELVVTEFGHTFVRVTDADIEIGLEGPKDNDDQLLPRAPVVTVMGHVDHGKTSLLDALRQTDVVGGEAGGITQHIGAYQVNMESGQKITFIDTPGHAAFSEMRARGANSTDIVILVVAADDGIKDQTIEAIRHAKAAEVPIVVAINKIDKPEANPDRVRQELMNHEIVVEEFGGDVMAVEVSAKNKINLGKLEEAILLQAEILELKANPNRAAQGLVVESRVDRGRGTVATVLVQKGTLSVGDIFVVGTEWGKIRALVDYRGQKLDKATPSMPVEVIGFNGVPLAGDDFLVVDNESTAREVSESRTQRKREAEIAATAKGAMDRIMSGIASGEMKEIAVVVKSDVQGSLEAITNSLAKLATEEVSVRILHGGVGAINESDVVLARASGGIVIGFNVRANPQARELSRRDNVDIRYYSIIYNVIDDVKAVMGGLLAPTLQENFIGTAEIREVFSVSKVGKIAGCMVRDGIVKRGNKVRLLRDNVVIHEGTLKTLRRFKDEVKDVREGYECGMAFESYNDIREGDVIECFEIESITRVL